MTPEQKRQIDAMSRFELAQHWRFGAVGDPLLSGEAGQYFKRRFFEEKGGFTPAISKAIGLGL